MKNFYFKFLFLSIKMYNRNFDISTMLCNILFGICTFYCKIYIFYHFYLLYFQKENCSKIIIIMTLLL